MPDFGPNPKAFFDAIYAGIAPWDIGAAQPALLQLFDELPPEGPALDLGCGTGDLAIALAERGLDATGVDYAAAAIAEARARAEAHPAVGRGTLRLDVADATRPSTLGRFRTICDSGFLHVLTPAEGDALVDELARAIEPGGRFYLLAFGIEFPMPNTPRAVTEAEVRSRFSAARGWNVLACRPAEFQSRIAPVPATLACCERR